MPYNLKTYRDREIFFLSLYKSFFPDIAAYIKRRGGTLENARDIFQETLVVYYEKTVARDAPVQDEKAYLMGVAKNLWYRMYAEGQRLQAVTEQNSVAGDSYEASSAGIAEQRNIADFLEQAGRKCMDMLKAFYYDKVNMKEMAESFGFRSVRSATVQKYKCLEKVRDKVREKSLHYEDFIA